MENKKFLPVVFITLLIAIAFLVFYTLQTREETEEAQNISTLPQLDGANTESVSTSVSEPTSENPPDQGDVRNQPAYLVNAITRHGKQYLGVDYVMVFHGEDAVQAQIEDGVCSEESSCEIPSEGYIRNNNPHFRSYEISTTTPLRIEVSGALQSTAMSKGLDTSSLTFNDLEAILPEMSQYVASEFPFKEAKSLVYIDVLGGGVTKIREP